MNSGYYPNVIKSLSGRLFEIEVTPVKHEQGSRIFCSKFTVTEYHPLYKGHNAEYYIGVDRQFLAYGEPFGIVQDVGFALLQHQIDAARYGGIVQSCLNQLRKGSRQK